MNETPGENREPKGIPLAVVQKLFDGFHGGVKTPVPPVDLRAVGLGHAPRGIEDDLDIGKFPFHDGWVEANGVSQEQNRHCEQPGGETVGTEHPEMGEPTPPLSAMVEGEGEGLTAADPFPEPEDDGEGEQGEPLGVEENHGRAWGSTRATIASSPIVVVG